MLKIAALVLASAAGSLSAAAAADTSDTLDSNAPWWERVTVTMNGDGKAQACRYETSLAPTAPEKCDVDSSDAAKISKGSSKGEVTRITFERRFTPGEAPMKPNLSAGDTLLGGQIISLAIDAKGSVKHCKVVATSGSVRPAYGCDEASAEKFKASLGDPAATPRQGYMTIIVYGHSEHMV